MENLKICVTERESKEVKSLLESLGFVIDFREECFKYPYLFAYVDLMRVTGDTRKGHFENHTNKELTIQQLRDKVVLKRNCLDDATLTHKDFELVRAIKLQSGHIYYWDYHQKKYVSQDEAQSKTTANLSEENLHPIEKEMKEYLEKQEDGSYELVLAYESNKEDGWIEVPEGAEKLLFSEKNSNHKHFVSLDYKLMSVADIMVGCGYWYGNAHGYIYSTSPAVIWQRNSPNDQQSGVDTLKAPLTNKEKLEWFDKFLRGVNVQFKLGSSINNHDTQWNNLTEKSLKWFTRNDIVFREKPKNVTLNGVEFKSKKSLIKYIENNYTLSD